ncbi:MAG: AAA family ATPase [Bacteroidia bacterium]|nr:AAA family ATPase [Bacteroidia bacterium]
MSGFRITNVTIKGQLYHFSPDQIEVDPNEQDRPYLTLIIGSNATGKSSLMRDVINIFRRNYSSNVGRERPPLFNVDFSMNGKVHSISQSEKDSVFRDSNGQMPSQVISLSNSLFDKFPSEAQSDDKFYQYIGIRSNTPAHSRTPIYELLDTLNENTSKQRFSEKVVHIAKILGMNPFFELFIEPVKSNQSRWEQLVEQSKNPESLKNFFIGQKEETKSAKVKNQINDLGFMEYLANALKNSIIPAIQSSGNIYYKLDFEKKNVGEKFRDAYDPISFLRRINYVRYSEIKVQKKGLPNPINIWDFSSGEISLLINLVRLAGEVRPNSLIFIDEPELSLHPNWQMKYVETLREFLKQVPGCHVVIATHSHFMVTDLKPSWSSILALRKNEFYEVEVENIPYSTFGWSPENILYNVFELPTVRNHYFEMDIRNLLSLIAEKSDDKEKIEDLLKSITRFQIHEDDPLNLVIQQAEKYLKNIT